LEKLKEEIQKYNEFVDQYFTKIVTIPSLTIFLDKILGEFE